MTRPPSASAAELLVQAAHLHAIGAVPADLLMATLHDAEGRRAAVAAVQGRAGWVAEGTRPPGQPGRVGRDHGAAAAWNYPAVRQDDGTTWFWRDSETTASHWIPAPARLAAGFEPGPDWQAACVHGDGPRLCDSEAQCTALQLEDERTWGR